jgi:hypothetical protein
MTISSSACEYWHPGEPPEIRTYQRKNNNGVCHEHFACAACSRGRARAKYQSLWAERPALPPLDWPAPEFLLRE